MGWLHNCVNIRTWPDGAFLGSAAAPKLGNLADGGHELTAQGLGRGNMGVKTSTLTSRWTWSWARREGKGKKRHLPLQIAKDWWQPTGINGRCRDLKSFETASADCSDDAVE